MDSEDVEMLYVGPTSITLPPRPSRELFINHMPSNGSLPLTRESVDSTTLQSNRTSRATSVLAKGTNQLSLGSPYDSAASDPEDNLPAAENKHTEPLPDYTLQTGLCYDTRMRFHTELAPPKDRSDYHPEDPRRIEAIFRALCEAKLVAGNDVAARTSNPNLLYRIRARPAIRPEILLVHDEAHFDFLKSTSGTIAPCSYYCFVNKVDSHVRRRAPKAGEIL